MPSSVTVDTGRPFVAWDKQDSTDMVGVMERATVQRTQSGIGADGHGFGPYAKSSVRLRLRKGLQVDHVDLTMSGAMLATLRRKATNYRGTVYPTVKYGWWINRLHAWIGFSEATMGPLDEQIEKTVDKHIKEANSGTPIPGTGD
jgi:hypothetical protein